MRETSNRAFFVVGHSMTGSAADDFLQQDKVRKNETKQKMVL